VQTIATKQEELIDMYSELEDWLERYEAIIDAGRGLAPIDGLCADIHKVKGCQSQVWIRPREEGALLHFDAYSDAVIVRGLIALLLQVYSGHPASEILATPPDFIDRLGLSKHLSMNRANGLNAMIRRIKACANAATKR
jgi:cysteine desulfuration protein SufE